jgi:hypothetical protein
MYLPFLYYRLPHVRGTKNNMGSKSPKWQVLGDFDHIETPLVARQLSKRDNCKLL